MQKLFVIMPFGKRTIKTTGENVDFDVLYSDILRKVAITSGWEVLRIDEVSRPGVISDQYIQELFAADLVLADITDHNANVFYEMGIRQAISPRGTIIIALKGTSLPFDIQSQRVIFYTLDESGLLELQKLLRRALKEHEQAKPENEIQEYLEKVGVNTNPVSDSAAFEKDLVGRIERAKNAPQLIAVWSWAQQTSPLPTYPLLSLAGKLAEFREWSVSVKVLQEALKERPNDYEVHRQLGWHLRHLGPSYFDQALKSFERAIELNSGDPETLGMMGGLYKRIGNFTKARECYSAGAKNSPDNLYMLVNQACMRVLENPIMPEPGVQLYEALSNKIQSAPYSEPDPWVEAVLGEAAFATGDAESCRLHFSKTATLSNSALILRSSIDQIEFLGANGFHSDQAAALSKWLRGVLEGVHSPKIAIQETGPPSVVNDSLPVLIHLSDIHFGTRIGKDGKTVPMHRFFDGDYSMTLSSHLEKEFKSKAAHFKQSSKRFYLIISGDLVYSGTREEFDQAKQFMESVCVMLDIPKERVFLVPGNHDVDWSVENKHRFDNYIACIFGFYGEKLFRERYPYITWNLRVDGKRPEPYQIISCYSDIHNPITIVSLNSCVYETKQDHYGFVGGKQIRLMEEMLEKNPPPTDHVLVCVIHHHLHPFPEQLAARREGEVWMDLSTIRDAGLVEKRLEKLGFDVVLHGHKHKPQLRKTAVMNSGDREFQPLIVCGAGSAGVDSSELEHNIPNHFEVIEFLRAPRVANVDFVRIDWRELASGADVDWVTSQSWVLRG